MLTTILTGALISVALVPQTDTVITVAPGTRLDIDTFGGEVAVQTWARNEMRIVANHSSRTRVTISQSSAAVRLRGRSSYGVATIDFEITVPSGTDVDVRGTYVSADMEGELGEVRVETVQGEIVVAGATGFAHLYSVQGDVELRDAEGNLNVFSTNGSLEVTASSGRVRAEATNGGITLGDLYSSEVEATTVNGTVRFDGIIEPGGRYKLGTHSGSVIAVVPEDIDATVSVSTFAGDFEAGFPITLTETWSQGKRFTFTVGDGSARIELESFSGSIRLRRR
ncbi:MAG: DUF4097 family beta strand repeat protein [Gemmatimonadota bacterium]|nr:MAG: DUF4097 family beta strand repeat protein [Gemmatimonadota bacterium]